MKQRQRLTFTTLVKIANGTSSAILIDEIKLNPDVIGGIRYALIKTSFIDVSPSTAIPIPFDQDFGPKPILNYLPFLVKSNDERQIAIEFLLSYGGNGNTDPFNIISKQLQSSGLGVEIRINGKYRSYTLQVPPVVVTGSR